jgi:RNA polymerase sigma factor (sigma-70 family)
LTQEGCARASDPKLPIWTLAYKRYYQLWVKLARSAQVSGEEADDIVQSVVASLLMNDSLRFESLEHLRNYVARSVLNRAMQMKKKANKHIAWNDALEERVFSTLERSPEPMDAEFAVYREAIRHLSRRDFEIIKYRFYAGLTFAQISVLLGSPVSTLKSREAAALRRLRRWIKRKGF